MCAGGANRVGVAKVQVGLLGSARSLQRDLERIAKRADTNSSDGLAYVLQGASVQPDAWLVCLRLQGCIDSQYPAPNTH